MYPLFDRLISLSTLVLAQVDAAPAAEPEPSFIQRMLANPLLLPIALFVIFYLTFIAPERRRKAEEAKLISQLAKNDRVITVGGIHGVVVSAPAESKTVTLKIDEGGNTRVKINRTAISSVVSSSAKDKAEKAEKE